MAEVKKMLDPFLNKQVEISTRLTDRLRGKYANGPTLPNGEPEFGWRQFETPPIQHEAADEIERLRKALEQIRDDHYPPAELEIRDCKEPEMIWQSVARRALVSNNSNAG